MDEDREVRTRRLEGRDRTRRGLLLIAYAVVLGLVLSLGQWIPRWMQESGRGLEWLVAVGWIFAWVSMGTVVVTTILTITGCLRLASDSAARRWMYVAIGGAYARLAATVVQFALAHRLDVLLDIDTLPLVQRLTLSGTVADLVQWLAIGLAVRQVMIDAGRRIPAWSVAVWSIAIAWELLGGVAQVAAMWQVFWVPDGSSVDWVWYGVGVAGALGQVVLLLGARRSLGAPRVPVGGAGSSRAAAVPLIMLERRSPRRAGRTRW